MVMDWDESVPNLISLSMSMNPIPRTNETLVRPQAPATGRDERNSRVSFCLNTCVKLTVCWIEFFHALASNANVATPFTTGGS
jgi:hypothetical protein